MSEWLAQPGVSYLVSAYGITLVGIAGYRIYLARERARLRRSIRSDQ